MSCNFDLLNEDGQHHVRGSLEVAANSDVQKQVPVVNRQLFKGLVCGLPISALLWWGIIELLRAMA